MSTYGQLAYHQARVAEMSYLLVEIRGNIQVMRFQVVDGLVALRFGDQGFPQGDESRFLRGVEEHVLFCKFSQSFVVDMSLAGIPAGFSAIGM